MAENDTTQKSSNNTTSTDAKPGDQSNTPERNSGTPDRGTFTTADTAVADAAGISEGEVKALRHDAGLNQLAGNEANTLAWESTPAGQEFLKGNKDREKKYAEEAKQYEKATNKDGLTEAESKYREAVDKARKG